jgi:hypothetical protein
VRWSEVEGDAIEEEGGFFFTKSLSERPFLVRVQIVGNKMNIRMASFDDLVRQMKRVGKKYRGRCEPELLVRTLYIDLCTAMRLAQYGEEHCGLRWKGRPNHLL